MEKYIVVSNANKCFKDPDRIYGTLLIKSEYDKKYDCHPKYTLLESTFGDHDLLISIGVMGGFNGKLEQYRNNFYPLGWFALPTIDTVEECRNEYKLMTRNNSFFTIEEYDDLSVAKLIFETM